MSEKMMTCLWFDDGKARACAKLREQQKALGAPFKPHFGLSGLRSPNPFCHPEQRT